MPFNLSSFFAIYHIKKRRPQLLADDVDPLHCYMFCPRKAVKLHLFSFVRFAERGGKKRRWCAERWIFGKLERGFQPKRLRIPRGRKLWFRSVPDLTCVRYGIWSLRGLQKIGYVVTQWGRVGSTSLHNSRNLKKWDGLHLHIEEGLETQFLSAKDIFLFSLEHVLLVLTHAGFCFISRNAQGMARGPKTGREVQVQTWWMGC